MLRTKNTMKLINDSVGKISNNYDIAAQNIQDIADASNNKWDLITNSFRFGYIQGMKAAKAEMKRKGEKEK